MDTDLPADDARGPGSANDGFGRHLALRAVTQSSTEARVEVEITASHLNGDNIVHGGVIFTLADQALAMTANKAGRVAVVSTSTIYFLRPAFRGDRLVATAVETHRGDNSALYAVEVARGGELIAQLTARARTVTDVERR